MVMLAKVLFERSELDESALLFRQALPLACDLGDRARATDCVDGMARIAAARGDSPLSHSLRAIADRLRTEQSTSVRDLAAPALAALD
jgi:hypothetical protein